MAQIIERYCDKVAGTTTVYACDGCGKSTKRRKSLPNRVVLCCDCQRAKAKAQAEARKDAIYQKGYADAIEPIKKIISESKKMMWHSDKTIEKIKEQLKERV